jgi:pyrimidine operon attenuation protein/uracil phosphoribosyltransferase
VRAAFRVTDRTAVAKKNVLVIDDIMTTGATARAAALALKRAGATTVWVVTLARARREGYADYAGAGVASKLEGTPSGIALPAIPHAGSLSAQQVSMGRFS